MLLLTKYTVLYKENEICCIILLSLPSRERGLKSKLATAMRQLMSSLPSWERGLKFVFIVVTVVGISRSLRGSMVANAVQNQTGIMPKAR